LHFQQVAGFSHLDAFQRQRVNLPQFRISQHAGDADIQFQAGDRPGLPLVVGPDGFSGERNRRPQTPGQFAFHADGHSRLGLDDLFQLRFQAVCVLQPVEDKPTAQEDRPEQYQQQQAQWFGHSWVPYPEAAQSIRKLP
jgi:hypothetical protein